MSLYTNNDNVIILKDSDFFKKNINKKKFKGPGILKAYAQWCPHCVNKAPQLKIIADLLKEHRTGKYIYVLDADTHQHISRILNVEAFPTFFKVNKTGSVGKKLDISELNDVWNALR